MDKLISILAIFNGIGCLSALCMSSQMEKILERLNDRKEEIHDCDLNAIANRQVCSYSITVVLLVNSLVTWVVAIIYWFF